MQERKGRSLTVEEVQEVVRQGASQFPKDRWPQMSVLKRFQNYCGFSGWIGFQTLNSSTWRRRSRKSFSFHMFGPLLPKYFLSHINWDVFSRVVRAWFVWHLFFQRMHWSGDNMRLFSTWRSPVIKIYTPKLWAEPAYLLIKCIYSSIVLDNMQDANVLVFC